MLADYHVHTEFSDDSHEPMEEQAKRRPDKPMSVRQIQTVNELLQELQDLDQRLEQYVQTSQKEIAKLQNAKLMEISDKVADAVKEIGVSGGYVYIMDVTAGIPFISETLSTDVTAQVKAKLGLK